jgi:hypothetical protein
MANFGTFSDSIKTGKFLVTLMIITCSGMTVSVGDG